MRYRIKIAQDDYTRLLEVVLSDLPREAGAFLLAGAATHGDTTDFLVRRVITIPKEQFVAQGKYHLEVSTQAINGLAALCEANKLGVIICHSHPEAIPYSPTDDRGEYRICETLRNFIPPGAPTASILLYPDGILAARVWHPGQSDPVPVDEIVLIGRSIRRMSLNGIGEHLAVEETHSRQVLAFGEEGQRAIAQAKVAVVGVGGTGSACTEQLARLGVKDFFLVDPDELEPSNVSRVYGSFENDARTGVGRKRRSKVAVISEHVKRINSSARVQALQAHVAETRAARLLFARDVIFLCTDDNWGRSIVNEVCYQYLIPAINLGVRLDSRDGAIIGAAGGVDVLRPDLPCLWCKQFLSPDRIAAEAMPKEARKKQQIEGYVQDLDTPAPSVISLNTTLAGLAVTSFIQLLTDFMGEAGDISRLNYDVLNTTVGRGSTPPNNRCVCKTVKGFGDLKPLSTVEKVSLNEVISREESKL